MRQGGDLPSDIEDELRAKSLTHFLLREESSKDCIVIEVYQNESWHPILQNWGSVVGVHLNAVLDRRPLTDETGNRVFRYRPTLPTLPKQLYSYTATQLNS
jgi:hypothetical protein